MHDSRSCANKCDPTRMQTTTAHHNDLRAPPAMRVGKSASGDHGMFHTAPSICCNMLIQRKSCLSALSAIVTFLICTCIANPTPLYSHSTYKQNANLTSATANLASSHGVQTNIHSQVQERSDIATLPPRSLSLNDFTRNWNLIFKDWQTFPPSSTTAKKAISHMYAAIHTTLINSSALTSPSKLVSFTCGGLRLTCQCAEEALPWGLIEAFLSEMMALVNAGFVGLYTVAFYFLKGSIIWSVFVIGLTLLPNARVGFMQNMIA